MIDFLNRDAKCNLKMMTPKLQFAYFKSMKRTTGLQSIRIAKGQKLKTAGRLPENSLDRSLWPSKEIKQLKK